jgi:hypothetical protein
VLLVGTLAGTVGFATRDTGAGHGGSRPAFGRGSPALAPPASAAGRRLRSEAEQIADRVTKEGSDLFDARRADALAASYTEDGAITLTVKDPAGYRDEVTRGRSDVERFYRDLFKGAGALDSENTVEFARLVGPDLLIIHGRFRPNAGEAELPFVQVRVKREDRWLVLKLSLFPGRPAR